MSNIKDTEKLQREIIIKQWISLTSLTGNFSPARGPVLLKHGKYIEAEKE